MLIVQALVGSAGVPTVGNVLPQAAKVSWLNWAASASACAGLSACYQWQLTIPKQPASAASWKKFHRKAAAIFSPTITAGFSPAQPSFHLWQLHVYLHPHSMFKWVVLQDLFRRKGAQELKILKDVNGVLKPVEWPESACACCTHVHTGGCSCSQSFRHALASTHPASSQAHQSCYTYSDRHVLRCSCCTDRAQ